MINAARSERQEVKGKTGNGRRKTLEVKSATRDRNGR